MKNLGTNQMKSGDVLNLWRFCLVLPVMASSLASQTPTGIAHGLREMRSRWEQLSLEIYFQAFGFRLGNILRRLSSVRVENGKAWPSWSNHRFRRAFPSP
ncbi:hypothetical protein DW66_0168 [Pseudomonas putida]|nr:hypothetical protein DW66_0168 [Pseudomonas putida]